MRNALTLLPVLTALTIICCIQYTHCTHSTHSLHSLHSLLPQAGYPTRIPYDLIHASYAAVMPEEAR